MIRLQKTCVPHLLTIDKVIYFDVFCFSERLPGDGEASVDDDEFGEDEDDGIDCLDDDCVGVGSDGNISIQVYLYREIPIHLLALLQETNCIFVAVDPSKLLCVNV